MLMNVEASVRVFRAPLGAGGGGSPGGVRVMMIAPYLRLHSALARQLQVISGRRQNCGLCGRRAGPGRRGQALGPTPPTPERTEPPSSRHGLPAARGAEPTAPAASAAQPPSRGLSRAMQLRRDARGLRAPRADPGLAASSLSSRHHRTGADWQQPDRAAAGASGYAARAAHRAPGRQPLAVRLSPAAPASLAGGPP